MSDRRHRSGHQHRSGDRAPRSTGSSSSQQYVLPSTTYNPDQPRAGSGGGHNSGSSHSQYSSGASARGRLYDQYGRDHQSTPSGSGSQHSQDVPVAYYPSSQSGSQQGSADRYFVLGSGAASSGSGSGTRRSSTAAGGRPPSAGAGRPPSAGEGPSQGYGAAMGTFPGYAFKQYREERDPIVYGPNSSAGKAVSNQKKSAFRRFVSRSAGKAKDKFEDKFLGKKK